MASGSPSLRLLLATTNRGKLAEARVLLAEARIDLVAPGDLGLVPDVEEDAPDYLGNAVKKARAGAVAPEPERAAQRPLLRGLSLAERGEDNLADHEDGLVGHRVEGVEPLPAPTHSSCAAQQAPVLGDDRLPSARHLDVPRYGHLPGADRVGDAHPHRLGEHLEPGRDQRERLRAEDHFRPPCNHRNHSTRRD